MVEILAAAGDAVTEDDPIIVIESDKASMEVPAGRAGVIERIMVAIPEALSDSDLDLAAAEVAKVWTGPAPVFSQSQFTVA